MKLISQAMLIGEVLVFPRTYFGKWSKDREFGLEYSYGMRYNKNGKKGNAGRVATIFYYDF